MTGDGGLVEVQATAERTPLSRAHLDELLALAAAGIEQLRGAQEQAIARRCDGRALAAGRLGAVSPVKLLLATHNEHKRREFARLLGAAAGRTGARGAAGRAWCCRRRTARRSPRTRSARRARRRAATGRVSIADDSGIAAAALGGAPGVRSARYAGEHATDEQNLEKLLREAPAGSALEYVCVIAYVDPASGAERVFEGRCAGRAGGRAARRAAASATTRRSCPTTARRA